MFSNRLRAHAPSPPAWIIRPAHDGARTFCVLGVARGGTSVVAGLLRQLGVSMGENLDSDNIEDLEFTAHRGMREIFHDPSSVEEKNAYLSHAKNLVDRRNSTCEMWGWKDPLANLYIGDLESELPNPHYVLIARDPCAIAFRELLVQDEPSEENALIHVTNAAREYGVAANFLLGCARPVLLVSYERALQHPFEAARTLAEFVRGAEWVEGQDRALRDLADYIRPERGSARLPPHSAGDGIAAQAFGAGVPDDPAAFLPRMRALAGITMEEAVSLDEAYPAAASLAQEGRLDEARAHAARCVCVMAADHPIVGLGPVAIARAADCDFDSLAATPDLLVGVCNILGLASLTSDDAGVAQDFFEAGYRLARRRLEDPRLDDTAASEGAADGRSLLDRTGLTVGPGRSPVAVSSCSRLEIAVWLSDDPAARLSGFMHA